MLPLLGTADTNKLLLDLPGSKEKIPDQAILIRSDVTRNADGALDRGDETRIVVLRL